MLKKVRTTIMFENTFMFQLTLLRTQIHLWTLLSLSLSTFSSFISVWILFGWISILPETFIFFFSRLRKYALI